MTISYFVHEDSGRVYACIGAMSVGGIFQSNPRAEKPEWEFLAPQSPAWDAIHQRIFRNFDTEAIEPGELPESLPPLPPLPEVPSGPISSASDWSLPSRAIAVGEFPYVVDFIRRQGKECITIFVILAEDTYETFHGDGEFHYFRDVCFSEEEALQCQPESEYERLHSRAVAIGLEDGVFSFPEIEIKPYDHYKAVDVLAAVDARLAARPEVDAS